MTDSLEHDLYSVIQRSLHARKGCELVTLRACVPVCQLRRCLPILPIPYTARGAAHKLKPLQ